MASYGNTVLTSAGIDLVQRVIANTTTFEITKVATSSDSRLTNATISTIEALTAMSSVQQTGKVTAFDTSNSKQVGLKCEFTNQSLNNQYDICGVGIYAKEAGKSEILFAVAPAKEPETMPAKPDDQSALFTFSLNMYVAVGQASAMSITATTEGVVKSINGTIKPDANGNVTLSYYSRAEVDQKVSSLSSTIDSLNSTKASSADLEAVKNRVSATESGLANAQSDISTLQHRADSITSTLSNGGVNLLMGTSSEEVTNTYPASGISDKLFYVMPVPADQTDYVLSFDAKSTVAGDKIFCYMYNPNQVTKSVSSQNVMHTYPDGSMDFNLTTDWVRYWVHYTIKPTAQTPIIIVGRTVSGCGSGTVSLKCVQLEYGDTATPWKPSNGDIASLQQTAQGLTADMQDAKGNISSLQATAGGLTIRLQDAEHNVSGLQQTAKGLQTAVSDNAKNISSVKQTAGEIRTDLTNAKDDIASVKVKADSLTTSMKNAQDDISTLQHRADSITSTLSNGGVNLLMGTSSEEVTNTYPASGISDKLFYVMPVPADQTDYVLSFDAKSTVAGDKIFCYMYNPNQVTKSVSSQNVMHTYSDGSMDFNLTTDWVRYWVHYTIKPTAQTPIIIVGRTVSGCGSGTVSLKCVQLEYGDTATPWKPSNGDITSTMNIANAAKTKADANANSIQALSRLMPQAAYIPIQIGDKTDLNDMKTCGFYMLQGETINSPVDGWVYVKVQGIPTRLIQFAWHDINPAEQWCRYYDGSNWLPWVQCTKANEPIRLGGYRPKPGAVPFVQR